MDIIFRIFILAEMLSGKGSSLELPATPSLSTFLSLSDHDYSAVQHSTANVTWVSMRPVPTLSMLGIYQQLISKTQAPRSLNVRHAIRSLFLLLFLCLNSQMSLL